ncbi:MAG: ABC transporter permease subunit [Clostridia bacterium]|nr:ABC transporter permease subunit [Clostridia bacterium]
MTVFCNELRRARKTFWIWTASIAAFVLLCVFLYPEMRKSMGEIGKAFAAMGSFATAFGMDRLDFGTLRGFYSVECGTMIGVGGAFFAAVTAAGILSGEEQGHTAEFLLTHPVTRGRVLGEKLLAALVQVLACEAVVFAVSMGAVRCIGETVPWREFALLHLAYTLCAVEIALVCFALSAVTRGNNYGPALGFALVMYFMSILANISDAAKVFKAVSPFGYADGADIITRGGIDWSLALPGLAVGMLLAAAGALYWNNKDIA